MEKVLVTGAAGFIGMHTILKLASQGYEVIGLDNINDYYDPNLKIARLKRQGISIEQVKYNQLIQGHNNIQFIKLDLQDRENMVEFFNRHQFDYVINLAAQAGVRYSLKNPFAYTESNITGFLSVLEGCRHTNVKHLVYASSSSVYGLNDTIPFSEDHPTEHPLSLYAASKKANEMMAHTYSHLYRIPTSGLRFFTVYGPWGRPDMALFIFTSKILKNEPIEVFNNGNMFRDFTYIDDIVEGIVRLIPKPPSANAGWRGYDPDPATSFAPYRIFNIGNSSPVKLMDFIHEIEKQLKIQAVKNMLPMQPGDVPKTWADVDDLYDYIDFKPKVGIKEGIENFISWYKSYFKSVPKKILSASELKK